MSLVKTFLFLLHFHHVLTILITNIIEETDDNYNPDVHLPTPDMIKRAGYPAEAHIVETTDGYLLCIHRIPGKFNSRPVFLQHGLLGSSADWVISGKQKSLAYLLADYGYDVWLGNVRGNTYSKAHISLSPNDSKFWNYSFHEIGVYDIPAVVNYITEKTQMPLIYIGHSMGTTVGYVMASEHPKVAENISLMISLAPVAFMKHIKSPIRLIAPYARNIALISHLMGIDEFLPQNILIEYLAKYGCELATVEEKICRNSMFVICGYDKRQFNETWLPVILSHTPAGASTKTMVHYAQGIISGQFQCYDYGPEKNLQIYNSTLPLNYNLSAIHMPIILFYADNDWLAAPVDVKILSTKLPNVRSINKIDYPEFNHLDFIWGIDARELLYNRVISLINKFILEEPSV